MSRVEIATTGWGVVTDRRGDAAGGVVCTILNRADASAATIYSALSGGSTTTGTATTNGSGYIPGFLAPGEYILQVPGEADRSVDVVSGSAESGIGDVRGILPGLAAPGAAVQAAIDSLGTNGGEILLWPGTHTWESVPKLPRDITGRLKIGCKPGAKVNLTASAPRLFDLDRTANDQLFTKIEICDFMDVDAGNLTGSGHVLIGTHNGAYQVRVNVDDFKIRRCRVYNVNSSTSQFRHGVYFASLNNVAGDSSPYFKNIDVEDVKIYGGLSGISVVAILGGSQTVAQGSDYTIDNINYRRCVHETGVTPTALTGGAANFFMVGRAHGGRVTIEDCYGKGSSDVGIEIDAATHATVKGTTIEDAWSFAFFHTNQNTPSAAGEQRVLWQNCRGRRVSSTAGTGFSTITDANFGNGRVKVRDGSWYRSTTDGNVNGDAVSFSSGFLDIDGLEIVHENIAHATGSSVNLSDIYLWPQGASSICHVEMRNLHFKTKINQTGASATFFYYPVRITSNSSSAQLRGFIDGAATDFVGTALFATTHRGIFFETCEADFRVSKWRAVAMTGDPFPRMTTIGGTSNVLMGPSATTSARGITFSDCDWAKLNGGDNGLSIGAGNERYVVLRNVSYPGTGLDRPTAITVGASPYAYQAITALPERVLVTGGTVSKIEWSSWNDGTNWTDLVATAGVFALQPGDYLRVTYTVAPTMTRIPLTR